MRREDGKKAAVILAAIALATALLTACGSGGEEGSGQYEDRTGSPLLRFGEEASASEREAAEGAVQAFLEERAAGKYEAACTRIGEQMLAKIEHLAQSSTGLADTSCPAFLEAFLRLSKREREGSAVADAGSLRRKGASGYLLYVGADGALYAMPLREEGGKWKLAALSPEQLG